jgi:hypothetical protein
MELKSPVNFVDSDFLNSWPVAYPSPVARYFNDFMIAADYAAADFVVTTTEAGSGAATEALAADEACGALKLTNDDADNDLDALQHTEEAWRLTSGKKTRFETRIAIDNTALVDFFIGLAITDTTVLDTTDRVGFQLDNGSADIRCLTEKNSSETSTSSEENLPSAVYRRLGFAYDGISNVKFYVDGVEVADHETNIPDDENLCFTVHIQNGSAAARNVKIDYIDIMQER